MKVSLLLGFVLLASSSLYAQGRFGLNGGLQITSLHSKDEYFQDRYDPKIGFRLGGFYEIPFAEKFGIKLEAAYSQAGAKGKYKTLDVHYVSLPILVYYQPIKRLKLYGGPEVNFLLHADMDDFNPVDFGVSTGIGFSISERLVISISNYFGLVYNSEVDFAIPFDPVDIAKDQPESAINRNNIFQIGLSFYLPQ